VVVGLVLGPITMASCTGHTYCDYAAPAATFTGPLTVIDRAIATFAVETSTAISSVPASRHVPVVGTSVAVRYSDDEQHFLRVGRRYAVTVWWNDGTFSSGVHHRDAACSTGTTYADGSAINKSVWSRPWVRRLLVGLVLLPVVAVGFLAWFTRRRSRAKPTVG